MVTGSPGGSFFVCFLFVLIFLLFCPPAERKEKKYNWCHYSSSRYRVHVCFPRQLLGAGLRVHVINAPLIGLGSAVVVVQVPSEIHKVVEPNPRRECL